MSIEARPFRFPYDGRWSNQTTALLVIDMQVDFLSPDGYFARKGYDPYPLRVIIPQVAKIVDAARAAGVLVIWTRQGYRNDLADMSGYERWRASRAGLRFEPGDQSLRRGGPGHEIVPELQVKADDVVVDKTANGAFYQTDLDLILRTSRIEHLIFTGCTTDVCVHTTLREANDRKFQCLLVEDACASADAYAHDAAIHMVTVEDGIFGTVSNVPAVLQGLHELGNAHRSER